MRALELKLMGLHCIEREGKVLLTTLNWNRYDRILNKLFWLILVLFDESFNICVNLKFITQRAVLRRKLHTILNEIFHS